MEKGVFKNNLSAKGYGSNKPVASNNTAEGRSKNRRTEFLILTEN
jgi:outer membrane protein OmpA-like peptidoglycan-associated protein